MHKVAGMVGCLMLWLLAYEFLGGGKFLQGTGMDTTVQLPDISPIFLAFSISYNVGMAFVAVFILILYAWRSGD